MKKCKRAQQERPADTNDNLSKGKDLQTLL